MSLINKILGLTLFSIGVFGSAYFLANDLITPIFIIDDFFLFATIPLTIYGFSKLRED